MSGPLTEKTRHAEPGPRRNDAILNSFYNSAGFLMGVVELRGDDDILHVYDNPATDHFFGNVPGSTAGRSARELGVPQDVIDVWLANYRECARSGQTVVFDYCHATANRTAWLRVSVSKIEDGADGRPLFSYIAQDITEGKQADQLRESSELRLSKMFETSPQPIWIFDIQSLRIRKVNAAAIRHYGYSEAEFLNLTIADICPPEDRHRLMQPVAVKPAEGASTQAIWSHVRKDGGLIEVEVVSHEVDYEGKPARWAMMIDVSERLKAERRLQRSEQRLAAALEAGGLGVFDSVLRSPTLTWDERSRALWGFKPEETVTYAAFMDAIHPEDRAAVETALHLAREQRGPNTYSATYRVLNRLGHSERWVRAEGGVIEDPGKPARFVGTVRDITEQKRTEAALSDQQRLHKAMTDNASLALFIMDDRQQCVFMNPAAEALTGFSLDELRGRPLHDCIHHTRPDGTHYPLSECPIDQALPQNDREAGEDVFVHKDGHFYDVRFTASPIRDQSGTPVGTVIEVEDITERKKTERKLMLMMREVEHRSRNMLAVVQAIATQTASRGDPREFAKSFGERLRSLAANHDLLVRNDWQSIDLRELVVSQLKPLGGALFEKIGISGPPIQLAPPASQAIGLALHELGTNAMKYGALSDLGNVRIAWEVVGGDTLCMRWTESGGPLVVPPTRKGFGSLLIAELTELSLQGQVVLNFDPSGLQWVLTAPLSILRQASSDLRPQ
jgi:PAS domain S-box-containing protein